MNRFQISFGRRINERGGSSVSFRRNRRTAPYVPLVVELIHVCFIKNKCRPKNDHFIFNISCA